MTQLLPNGRFDGELDGKSIRHFADQLDYTLLDTQDRINKIKEILYTQGNSKEFVDKFFELFFDQERERPYFKVSLNKTDALSESLQVCKSLEFFSNYILFNREQLKENDYSEYPYLDGNDRLTLKKKESSYEDLLSETDENGNSRLENELVNKKNFKKKPPYEIEARDLDEIKEIKEIQNLILYIKSNLLPSEENNTKKRFLMRMMKELRQEQIAIKKIVRKPIEFKSLMCDETLFNYDSDTGYYNGNGDYKVVSENRIDLANPNHIYHILNNYADLKEGSYDNLNSDMRYILETLEDLIDKVDLRDFERDVLIMKIDGLIAEDILEQIQIKYGLVWSEPYLTRIFKNIIPRKISEQYLKEYEDWFYFTKAKGDYKQCSKCGEVKLISQFGWDSRNKDGYKSICRECDRKSK
jgi:hypothetical protein